MVSEKQRRLCMRFHEGSLQETEPPVWFIEHLEQVGDTDWQGSLSKCGCSPLEGYGETGDDTYEIYRSPNGYFVDYTDVSASAAWIFIDRPVDYLTFRAKMLWPLVMLARESERQAAEELAKRKQDN